MCDNNDLNNQTFGDGGYIPPQPQNTYAPYIPYGFTPKTLEEKQKIKKAANAVGVATLLMTLLSGVILYAIRIIFSFSYSFKGILAEILNDAAFNQFFQIVMSCLLFSLPFVFSFKYNGYRISDLIEFKKPKKKTVIPLFLMGIAFCAFSNIAVSFAGSLFESFGVNYEVDFGEDPKGIFGFLLSLLSTAIVPPLMEEFACRGIMLGALRKFGDGFAIVTSAVIFGLMHGNFEQIPFAFLVGLILGYITVKSESIWIAVAVHSFNNLIPVIFSYLRGILPQNIDNAIYVLLLTVLLILGLAALLIFNKCENSYELEKSDTEASEGQKLRWFFSSVTIIIFIVISLLESMQYFIR